MILTYRVFMVLIPDGNSEPAANAERKIVLSEEEEKVQFVNAFDLVKCLKQIK